MNFFRKHHLVLRRLFFLLFIYTGVRFAFFLYHSPSLDLDISTLAKAFILGLRFDLSALIFINAPFFVLWLIYPWKTSKPLFDSVFDFCFLFVNSVFLFINLVDIPLVSFVHKRMTLNFLNLLPDWIRQTSQLSLNYWWVPLLTVLLFFLIKKGLPPKYKAQKRNLISYFYSFALLALLVVGARGGLQYKPISVLDGFWSSQPTLNLLTLNTSFTFLHSLTKRVPEKFNWLDNLNLEQNQCSPPSLPNQKPNIVLIILESFSLEYMLFENEEKNYTPFLNSLKTKSLFFPYHMSNGTRSIESLPSLYCGIPSLLETPLLTSPFADNKFECFPQLLEQIGYQTSFFHGAATGTMFFDSFAKKSGVSNYFGIEQYPTSKRAKDFDGTWGIYDKPYLKYFLNQVNQMNSPFFTTLFTLSSHQPFTLPLKDSKLYKEGTHPIHKTIRYTDNALKVFFSKAQTQPWFSDTLFIITADHIGPYTQERPFHDFDHFKVPLLFYWPKADWTSVKTQKVTQHIDLFPTLVQTFNLPHKSKTFLGQNIFCSQKGQSIQKIYSKDFLFVNDNSYGFFHQKTGELNKVFSHQNLKNITPIDKSSLTGFEENKKFFQYFNNTLLNNTFGN